MTSSHPDASPGQWSARLASALDRRSAPRLVRLFLGAILARGRRAVTGWIRAAGLSRRYRPCYATVAAAGKEADGIAARRPLHAVAPLVADRARLTPAPDDAPTQRYGPYVPGAGIHHDPAPGPAGAAYVSGPIRVVLGPLAAHPARGVMALPLLARMYVRAADLPRLAPRHRPEFRAEPEPGVALLRWARTRLRHPGKPLWVVVDGASAEAPFLRPAMSPGMTVVSRLRKDAASRSVPGPRVPGRRGRPRIYGERRSELIERAGRRRGWATGRSRLYGKWARKRYKTSEATWRPAGGAIRVVSVDEPTGRVASSCADVQASVTEVLETASDRSARETASRDCEEIVGAGQRQVRFVWANIGASHICLRTSTMTEAWARGRAEGELVDRRESPWDDPDRRPSRAEKRKAWRRELLAEEIRAVLRPGVTEREIRDLAERLLNLAA